MTSQICVIYAFIHGEVKLIGADCRHDEQCMLRRVWADQSEQTGYSVFFGGEELKETGPGTEHLGQDEKINVFIGAWKTFLVVTQNELMTLKMSMICLLY